MGSELKASLEVDFSKAEATLRELDRKQKAEDAKADVLDRRAQRIGERLRDADAQARRLESQLDSKLGSLGKRQAKTALKAFAFDTLSHFADSIDNQALKGAASIVTDGLMSFAESGNPAVALVSAAMKAVEVLKNVQAKLAEDLRSFRDDTQRRFDDFHRDRAAREKALEEKNFKALVDQGNLNFRVAKEENELIRKTWLMMEGLGGN